jgi:hypothetical protein
MVRRMPAASISLRWTLFLFVIILGGAFLVLSSESDAAPDGLQLWNEDFTRKASAARDGGVIGITATDLVTFGGTNHANVSDPSNPGDFIHVTLFDDGTNGDVTLNDGIFTGTFTVVNGTTGDRTNASAGAIDIAEGDKVSVYVDLDNDGSFSQVTIGTDYHGPNLLVPFEGGYVSGRIIITVTIIVEGDAEIDPTSITYSIDFGPAIPFDQIAPLTWRAIIDTYNLTDGPHTVTTNAGDVAGNLESSTIEFIADNTVPDIFHVGTVIDKNGDILIDTLVRDEYLDTDSLRWRWDEGPWNDPNAMTNDDNVSEFRMSIGYDDLLPGLHSIEVNARDLANNSMTRITRFTLPEQSVDLLTVDINESLPFEPVACSTMVIPLDLDNLGPVPVDLDIDLIMDGTIHDSTSLRLNAVSCETVPFILEDLPYGEHDVRFELTAPRTTSGDEPFLILPVTTDDNDTFFVDPPLLFFNHDDNASYFPLDVSLIRPGQEFIIDGTIHHSELLDDQNATLEVVIDNETAKAFRMAINLTGNESAFFLKSLEVSEGTHDVELNLYLPGIVSPHEPAKTLPVLDLDGGPFHVGPVRLFFDTNTSPLRTSINDLRPGDTFTITPWVGTLEWEGVYDVWVDLVVDGEVVDRVRDTIRGNRSGKEFALRWDNITHGAHKIEVRLYSDDHEDGFIPIETREVRDLDGRTLIFSPIRLEMDELSENLPEVSSFYRPGEDLHLHTTVFSSDRPGEYNFTVQLVVDGEVVDTYDGTHRGDSTLVPVNLTWENMTVGEHNITLRLIAPELYGTDEPWQEIFVKDAQGYDLDIEPIDMDLWDGENQFRVDTERIRPGDDVVVTGGVINWERPGEYPYTIQLVVDGEVVDSSTGVHLGNATADRQNLTWRNATSGDHDVRLILLAPDGSGVLQPIDTRNITDMGGGPVIIEPPRISLGDDGGPFHVDTSRVGPGDTLTVDVPLTIDETENDSGYRVRLSIDGEYVDEDDGFFYVEVSVTHTVPLQWREVTEGEHSIEVHLFPPDAGEDDEPYRVLVVVDENGDPIVIPSSRPGGDGDGNDDGSSSPLDVFDPINDLLPLEAFPENSRPWVVPALLVVTIIGASYVLTRKGRPKTPTGSSKGDLKPVELPPPDVDLPDVSKTPSPSGPIPLPYPNTGTTSGMRKGGPGKIKAEAEIEKEVMVEEPDDEGPKVRDADHPKEVNPGWHGVDPGVQGEGGDIAEGGGPEE